MICVRSSLYCSSAAFAARGSSLPSRAARWINIWVLNAAPLAQCLRDLREQMDRTKSSWSLSFSYCTVFDCIAEFLLSGEALEETTRFNQFILFFSDIEIFQDMWTSKHRNCLLYSTLLSSMRLFCVLLFFLLYSLTWNHSLPRADRSLAGWGSG